MKMIKQSLAAMGLALAMGAPTAMAQSFPTAPPGEFTGVFFDNVEYCIGCSDGIINVSDQFVIGFRAQIIKDAGADNSGQTGPLIWSVGGGIAAPAEITGYLALQVVGFCGVDCIVFGPTVDPNGVLPAGTSLAIYTDNAVNYNDTTQGAMVTTTTDGVLHSTYSLGYQYILASTVIPAPGPVGTSYGGFNLLTGPAGFDLAPIDDPNEVFVNQLVDLFFNTEVFRLDQPLACVGPACANHFGSNDPAVFQVAQVPEPGTLALLGLGLLGLCLVRRRA